MNILSTFVEMNPDRLAAINTVLSKHNLGNTPICALPSTVSEQQIAECDILFGNIHPAKLATAHNLKWHHTASAGVAEYCPDNVYCNDVLLSNSAGAYGIGIAEHLVAMTMALLKRFPEYIAQQQNHDWHFVGKVRSVYGSKVTVVGLGDIGSEFAKRMAMLGAIVTGVKRSVSNKPDYLHNLLPTDKLDYAIANADIVALCMPGTSETQNLFSEQRLTKLKKDCIILNVGRGNAIDEVALIKGLQSGDIGGAGLDVTTIEPLAKDSPLWNMNNVIITPHVSGNTSLDLTLDRIVNQFCSNLDLFLQNKPIDHLVDKKRGY